MNKFSVDESIIDIKKYPSIYRKPKDIIIFDDKTLEDILLEHDRALHSRLIDPNNLFMISPQQSELDLSNVDLKGRDLRYMDLRGINFYHANLSHANFKYSDLNGANLSFANLSYVEYLEELDNANLFNATMIGANMSNSSAQNANFTNAILTSANLSYSTLNNACMHETSLMYAKLNGTNLADANLSNAFLTSADLTHANLPYANLSNSKMENCILNFAKMYDTKIDGANMHGASLMCTDLSGSNGNLIEYRKGKILRDDIIGYKKCVDENNRYALTVTLKIPRGSIIFSINGKKCRTNRAIVMAISGADRAYSLFSGHYMSYYVGDEINIYNFNCQYNRECAEGIHFFMTREEAEEFVNI